MEKEAGKQITRKVQFPQYREIDAHCFVLIDGHFSQIYNVAHTTDKDGFPVTELTLIEPENNLTEVEYD